MSSITKRIKHIFAFLLLSVSFLYTATSLANSSPSDKEVKAMSQQAVQFLSTTSLYPYFYGDGCQFKPLGTEKINQNMMVFYAEISNDKAQLKVAFLVNKDKVKLLYVADQFISSQLFADLIPTTYAAAQNKAVDSAHIYIKNKNYDHEKGGDVEWVFFNNKVIEKLNVNLMPDGQGGTNFTISQAK